ncbi:MAG: hypothetical protein ACXVGB_00210 [Mycobacteriaceae bacterium]
MTTETTERDQLYFDIFVTALEGGIGYWSECSAYHWMGDSDSGDDLLGFYAVVNDVEDEDKEYIIDRSTIVKGFNAILSARAPFYEHIGITHTQCADVKYLGPGLARAVRMAHRNIEEADFDAADADAIVQVGLFGELVYG